VNLPKYFLAHRMQSTMATIAQRDREIVRLANAHGPAAKEPYVVSLIQKLATPPVARNAGTKSAVAQWESGKNVPDPRKLNELVRLLALDPYVAIGRDIHASGADYPLQESNDLRHSVDTSREPSAGEPPQNLRQARLYPLDAMRCQKTCQF
jgi:transcriptional regulator with XRE-family HTH domain